MVKVLEILHKLGLTVTREKCKFLLPEVEHLGHIISEKGVQINSSKLDPILHAPSPTNLKELQSFLGGVNYYGKFIENMASICKPLYRLLGKQVTWEWELKHQEAFEYLKLKLSSSPILVVYDKILPLKLDCDASQ